MKPEALVPIIASAVGVYLILRSGYLRAVLRAPFRRASDRQLVIPLDESTREPSRQHASVH